jgi:hypothetical protein
MGMKPKNSEKFGNMKYFSLIVMVLTIVEVQAQEPVLYGNDAAISKGISVDSPNILLSWGAPMPDSPDYHLKIRRIMKNLTVVEWDTVTIFNVRMDSIFMHYVTAKTPQTIQWQGFHSIFLYFQPEYTDRMKALFDHLFGPPITSRNKRGRFDYIWKTENLFAFISNRKRYAARNGHVDAYIGIPHYIQ